MVSIALILISMDMGPKFSLGRLLVTPNALSQIPKEDIERAIQRHVRGDWGELDQEDNNDNDQSLETGCRLLSAYKASTGVKFWIITEADRSVTTVLLPEDY